MAHVMPVIWNLGWNCKYAAQLFDKKSYDKLWHLCNGQISALSHCWSPVERHQIFDVGFWFSPDVANNYSHCS